jgi:hypothetical protein
MKSLAVATILTLGSVAGVAQEWKDRESVKGSGNLRSENRNVGNFNAIDIGGAWQVEVKVGNKPSVKVEIDDNLLQYVETKIEDGTLHVGFKKNTPSIRNSKSMKVWITAPELKSVDISGACSAKVDGLRAQDFRLDCSGASKVKLNGSIERVTIDASGASSVDLIGIALRTALVDASGASSVTLNVRETLKVDASGASSVRYKGKPSVQRDTSGVSSVKPIN